MKKAFKLFMLILIGMVFAFNFASCDDISFTYRRHQDKDKDGYQKSKYISNGNGTGTATLVSNGQYWDELNIPMYDLLGDVSSYDVAGIFVTFESGNYNAGVGYNSSQLKWDYDKGDYTWWNKQELTYGYSQTFYDVSFAYSGDNEYIFKFYISTGTAGDTATITWSVVTHAKLNAGDIFVDQDEDMYLKVKSNGNIDFYEWNEDTYSYELTLSNGYYNIENSVITITYSYYDGNYHTDTFTGNFDGTMMTFFDDDGYLYWTLTKVTSVPRILKTATDFSTITLENNFPYNNHAMIEWIASDNKYKLNAGQRIKFTISGFTDDVITVSKKNFTAALVDTTSYTNGWIELSDYVNAQYGTMLDYSSYFEAVFIIELTSMPSNTSAEACKFELSVGDLYDTQDDITIYVSAFEVELLE
ncbi:MAG: hypothetical protein HDR35_08695 [Treponema sp.]|nr:hypothetical protein [Treponema sp.]MBD5447171.1 hypothetical protein [Treponema sp.]